MHFEVRLICIITNLTGGGIAGFDELVLHSSKQNLVCFRDIFVDALFVC